MLNKIRNIVGDGKWTFNGQTLTSSDKKFHIICNEALTSCTYIGPEKPVDPNTSVEGVYEGTLLPFRDGQLDVEAIVREPERYSGFPKIEAPNFLMNFLKGLSDLYCSNPCQLDLSQYSKVIIFDNNGSFTNIFRDHNNNIKSQAIYLLSKILDADGGVGNFLTNPNLLDGMATVFENIFSQTDDEMPKGYVEGFLEILAVNIFSQADDEILKGNIMGLLAKLADDKDGHAAIVSNKRILNAVFEVAPGILKGQNTQLQHYTIVLLERLKTPPLNC
jgi:hypothetical protein